MASSDNKNRTVSEVRHLLDKYGGRMSEAGSVAWMFQRKGRIIIEKSKADEENLMNLVLEAGAEDLQTDGNEFEVIVSPHNFENVRKILEDQKVEMASAEVAYVPKTTVAIEGKEAEKVLKLMEALEDNIDVQNVHANFDIPDAVMEQVAAK